MKKVTLGTVIIEVTRRCNMKCGHCLRGPAQKKDQTKENIDKLLSQTDYISDLTFTGGEPSLVPEIIEYTLEAAKRYGVNVGNFYIVTNGKKVTEKFALACLKWYAYCDDNEVTSVELSQDAFHDEEGQDDYDILKGLSFFSLRERSDSDGVTPEGRAKDWGTGRELDRESFYVDEEENGFRISEGMVYLNCKGELIGGCDWSYRNQTKHKICDVGKMSLNAFEAFGAEIEYQGV